MDSETNQGWGRKLLTVLFGGFLWYYGAFLFVPLVFAYGYIARVVRAELESDTADTPAFDDWRTLLVDGARIYAIWVIFAAVLFLNWQWTSESGANGTVVVSLVGTVLGGGVLFALVPMLVGKTVDFTAMVGGPLAQSLDTYLLMVAILYVAPAMVAHATQRRRFLAAFSFSTFRSRFLHPGYARAWVGFFVRWVASTTLLYVPLLYAQEVDVVRGLVGIVLIPAVALDLAEYVVFAAYAVSFYFLVSAYAVVGRAWRDLSAMTEVEEAEEPEKAEQSVGDERPTVTDATGAARGSVSE
ncbi:hypothetical protein AUR64_16770 [Haloprofundus marisrubri]|uniref:DUF4013 domain-containing protein n=1 Tax=Haloprofundus marisrubri TaxID=1514971 RepID=A0A0W1R775_9EURY|nr:DUF4013 domain-containing protein [Haloprofundus marisrubri]KTG09430.1 hypothetical protein AUR64_16770 [Haloprofundus marisrubri]